MSLTDMDIQIINDRAEIIADRVAGGIIERVILSHIETCPHGKALLKTKLVFVGICIGSSVGGGLAGGGIAVALIRVLFGDG